MDPISNQEDVCCDRLSTGQDRARTVSRVNVVHHSAVWADLKAKTTGFQEEVIQVWGPAALQDGRFDQSKNNEGQRKSTKQNEKRETLINASSIPQRRGRLERRPGATTAPRALGQHLFPEPPPEEDFGRVSSEGNAVPVRAKTRPSLEDCNEAALACAGDGCCEPTFIGAFRKSASRTQGD